MSDFYKPLTPSLRKEINVAIENQIRELETCEKKCICKCSNCWIECAEKSYKCIA